MRSALRIFRKQLDKVSAESQDQRLKEIGLLSNPLRDLDVMISKVQQYLTEQTSQGLPNRMLTVLEERQNLARDHVIAHLESEKYKLFRNDFAAFLDQPLIHEDKKLQEYGKFLLSRCLNRARKVLQKTGRSDLEKMHKLRIRLKDFRYGIELLSEVLEGSTEEIINQMIRLQDHLGELHDTAVEKEILHSVLQDMGSRDPAVIAYLDYLNTRLQTLLEEFPQLWEDFNNPTSNPWLNTILPTH
jgi:CHAD domain-containing protein